MMVNYPQRRNKLVKPVGSKRIAHNGYVQIKTEMGQARWPWEHRVVWEQYNGPIPKGSFIHHLNHIPTDNRIENLQLVNSNSEHHHIFHRKRPLSHGEKVSKGNKGKPKSPEHRLKIGTANKGKVRTPEQREKIRQAVLNQPRDPVTGAYK